MTSDEAASTSGPPSSSGPASGGYVFDNAGAPTADRFAGLSAVFDRDTFRSLDDLGVASGWRCLDVGAGNGSVARWLASRVGPAGRVVATDIDTRHLDPAALPGVEVLEHDVTTDPLPPGQFDLIHARLVLHHLPARDEALRRLVTSLAPGGCVLFEEFDGVTMPVSVPLRDGTTPQQADRLMVETMSARGVDFGWVRTLPDRLEQLGLLDVDAVGRVFRWRGGTAGAAVLRAAYLQLADAFVGTGRMSADDHAAAVAATFDPSWVVASPLLWSVSARRAGVRGPA